MQTLGIRLDREQSNALAIAQHSRVIRSSRACTIRAAGAPGFALHALQARGGGSIVSFETGDAELSQRVVESLQHFTIAVSFGSVSSLASLPCRMSHKSIPSSVRSAHSLPDDLVRLSIGIEDVHDLIEDLDQALRCATRHPPNTRSACSR